MIKDNDFDFSGLYEMQKSDIDKFAETIGVSFCEDKLVNYLNGGKYKKEAFKGIFKNSLKSSFGEAYVYGTSKNAEGVIVVMPPNFKGTKTLDFILSGGIKLPFTSHPTVLSKLISYENYAMQLKKEATQHKSWYLFVFAVKEEYRHQGYATELMKPFLEYFNRNTQFCYLETHNPVNVEIYKHYGWYLFEQGCVPKTNITHYAMLRRPFGL